MKQINVFFDDKDYEGIYTAKKKSKKSWRSFILDLVSHWNKNKGEER